jgi:transcriptional regulator with XRE-family HTH domain
MPLVNADRLRYEMHARGLLGGELAQMAGIDANTVSRALRGRPVTVRTLRRITTALLTQPPLRVTADLIAKPDA